MADVKKPCVGCVYFTACGESGRTAPCKGRATKSEKKRELAELKKKARDRRTYFDEELGSFMPKKEFKEEMKDLSWDEINAIGIWEDNVERYIKKEEQKCRTM